MHENTKRLLTLMLAAAMLFSMMPMGVSAQEQTVTDENNASTSVVPDVEVPQNDETESSGTQTESETAVDATALTLDQPAFARITAAYQELLFSFTPEQTGIYVFTASSTDDTKATLLDANLHPLASDDDGGENMDFSINYTLTAGQTYYLRTSYYGNTTGTFFVWVERGPLASIVIDPVSIMPETCGFMDSYKDPETGEQAEYFYYQPFQIMEHATWTVTYSDGTTATGSGNSIPCNNTHYQLNLSAEQNSSNQWTPGNTYTVSAEVLGLTTEFEVTIAESPLVNLEFSPITVIENSGGNMNKEWDEQTQSYVQYYYYDYGNLLAGTNYTATFSDSTINGNGLLLKYNGFNCNIRYNAVQDVNNQWTAGNTYYVTVSVMGKDFQVPVTVVKNPLVSLEFSPVSLIQNTNGYMNSDWDPETQQYVDYYWYYTQNFVYKSTYTATFSDDTVLTGSGYGFEYQGVWYDFSYESNQSVSNPWLPGETYPITVSVMGKTATLSATIRKNPLVNLVFDHAYVMQETNGWWDSQYDAQTGTYTDYYRYEPHSILNSWTAYFDDGTELTGSGTSFVYEDETFFFDLSAQQSAEDPWTAGNTYYVQVSVMETVVSAPVTIVDSYLANLEFSPVTVTQGSCGNWNTDYDSQTNKYTPYYFCYDLNQIFSAASWTATLVDGTQLTGQGEHGFYFQGDWYDFIYSAEQSYENPWAAGSIQSVTVQVAGTENTYSIPVTIEENTLVSLEFTPIITLEGQNGWHTTDWDQSTESYTDEYFKYSENSLIYRTVWTAKFEDGTEISSQDGSSTGFDYQGQWYSFDFYSDQSYENQWTVGNTYTMQVYMMGETFHVPVIVADKYITDITFAPISIQVGTGGWWTSDYDQQTGISTPSYYIYDVNELFPQTQWTVTLADGTQQSGLGDELLYFQGGYYGFSASLPQTYDTRLTAGNTYDMTVSILEQEFSLPVTIEAGPLTSLEFSPVEVMAESNGYWHTDWLPETETESEPYYYYYTDRLFYQSSWTATFADGTVITSDENSSSGFEYQGQWYEFSFETQQHVTSPWTVGNTYHILVHVMGQTYLIPVSIVKNPLESLSFAPLTYTEQTGGSWRSQYNPETDSYDLRYYCYDSLFENLYYTAVFSDGTVLTGYATEGFTYNGIAYGFGMNGNNQSFENPWTAGNTYTVTMDIMGVEADASITIAPSPLTELTIAPITVTEGTRGHLSSYNDPETGEERWYYYYNISELLNDTSYTAIFSDGTELTGQGGGFMYDGQWRAFVSSTHQNYENQWTAGNTYYIEVEVMARTVQVPVTITASPLTSLVFSPVSVLEHTRGNWNTAWNPETETEDLEYYHYSDWQMVELSTYTATFSDGTVLTGRGSGFTYNGQWYEFSYNTNQGYENAWTVGNTYSMTVSAMGKIVQIPVTIQASPVRRITIAPLTVFENTNGYEQMSWNPETGNYDLRYFYYQEWQILENAVYTVEFTDDTSISGTGRYFWYDGQDQYFEGSANQSYETRWTAGNTYSMTVTLMGQSIEVPVTILESPLQSLEFSPISVTEYSRGDWKWDWNDETESETPQYYYYNEQDMLWLSSYTARFADGTVLSGQGSGFSYRGQWYDFSYSTEQSYNNQWTAGNTYAMNVSIMGISVQIPVTISKTPLVSLTFSPITVFQGTHGNTITDYDPQTGSQTEPYFFYSGQNLICTASYTARFSDGTVLSGMSDGFNYQGQWYSFDYESDQRYENQWTAGNTYTLTVTVMNYTVEVPVTIAQSPVTGIFVQPVEIYQNTNGYWSSGQDHTGMMHDYYYYEWQYALRYTVFFNDGSSVNASTNGFWYQGVYYYLECFSEQDYPNRWTAGNTYNGTISVMGFSSQIPVTILETPIANIQVEPLYIQEYDELGGWNNDQYGRYYYYDWSNLLEYTVTFKSGETVTATGRGLSYNGEYHHISESDDQGGHNPWQADNAYDVQFSILGYEAETTVHICKVSQDNGFSYIVKDDQVVIVDCTRKDAVLEVPAAIDGLPVTGIDSLGKALQYAQELIIPDSVTNISEGALLSYTEFCPLKKLTMGSGITELDAQLFLELNGLEEFAVSENNPAFTSYDGVIYTKDMTTMVMFPVAKKTLHVVPDSVTNVDVLFENPGLFAGIGIQFGAGISLNVSEDGIVYNEDKTYILMCTDKATGSYVMPDTVTGVAYYAFSNSKLTEITLSENLTEVVTGMFQNSLLLETVNIPEGVTKIGEMAFQGCESLKTAQIPGTVTRIGYSAYDGCEALEGVYIEDLNTWGGILFSMPSSNPLTYCGKLYLKGERVTDLVVPDNVAHRVYEFTYMGGQFDTVTVPETVYTIASMAFYLADIDSLILNEGLHSIEYEAFGRSTLSSLELPDSLFFMESYSFADCPNLESVTFGTGMQVIESYSFEGSGLKSVVIPGNIQYVGYRAFADTQLEEVTFLGESIEIGESAFRNCPLKELVLTDNVSLIGFQAFQGIGATQVKLPDSITQIAYGTFAQNQNLVSVSIPDSVTSIEGFAFGGDSNLSHVLYGGTQEQWEDMPYNDLRYYDVLVHYQATGDEITTEQTCTTIRYYCSICDTWQTVQKADPQHNFVDDVCTDCGLEGCWNYAIDTEQQTVTIVGYLGKDKDILVPEEIEGLPVTSIAYGAFRGSAVEYVELPETVSSIAEYAFADCESLIEIYIPAAVTRIRDHVFHGCSSLEFLELSETVNSIGAYAFAGCSYMTLEKLPDGLTFIGENAFENCRSIYELTIPEGVTEIPNAAFSGCSNLNSLTLPDTVTSIGYWAFSGCEWLQNITIPASVEEISQGAFAYCYDLSIITFLGDAPHFGNAFDGTSAIAYYPGTNETWEGIDDLYYDSIVWKGVYITVTAQPEDVAVSEGEEAVITIRTDGESLKHRWWYAAPGSDTFVQTEQEGRTFRMTMDESCNGGRVYCVITDLYGQTEVTETATLQIKVVHVHDYTEDPTTCGTCGHVRMTLKLNTVTLKSSVAGLYYKGQFTFDEETENSILGYGIAVSLVNQQPVADGSDETCLYTNGSVSAVLANIMEGANTAQNKKNAKMPVYARAYVQLADGTYVYSNAVSASLQQMVQAIDAQAWSGLSQAQKEGLAAMYESFADVMASWNIPNLKQYIED